MKLIFQNMHENKKIIDLAWKIVPTFYNFKSFETMKVNLLKEADVPASLHPFRNFEQSFTSSSSTRLHVLLTPIQT